jgi:flavin reductase (DIM6/NTAB) family NADH-FMN oxidoreductase RutF
MNKKPIGARTFLYPMPVVLVGAKVAGRPNYLPIAYCGIVQHTPPMIAVTLGKAHHTNAGIKENQTFSVNLPSEELLAVTDYCGLHTGRDTDKAALFSTFYGRLESAPMIEACPLNLECRLRQTLDFEGANEVFIGEIVEAYSSPEFLTDGLPDIRKLRSVVFSMHDNTYWSVGECLGKAWSIGKDFPSS